MSRAFPGFPVVAVAFAALLGCGASPTPAVAPESSAPVTEASSAPAEEAAPVPGAVKRDPNVGAIPEDYSLTERDCEDLGKQYGSVSRSDQRATLDPKLSAKQRAQVDENIDHVVSKLEDGWIERCRGTLAGKIVDRASLKCAMGAKTLKGFDVCLNGDAPVKNAKKKE